MSKVFIEETSLTAIGDAIRAKTGSTELLSVPSGMVDAIASITTGGGSGDSSGRNLLKEFYTNNFIEPTKIVDHEVINIKNYAFHSSGIYAFESNSMTSMSDWCFANAEIRRIELPNLMSFGQSGLEYCPYLKEANFPKVTDLGINNLRGCNKLTSVKMPNLSAASSANAALRDSVSLKNVYFKQIDAIPTRFLSGCTNLVAVDLPETCTTINTYAFADCSNLSYLVLRSPTVVTLSNKSAFSGCSNLQIVVPNDLVDSYNNATNWASLYSTLGMSTGSVFVSMDYFTNRAMGHYYGEETSVNTDLAYGYGLTGLELPNVTEINYSEIDSSPFKAATWLAYLKLDNATVVGGFDGCVQLEIVHLPKVQTINANAFNGCSSLRQIDLPASLTAIGANAFNGCFQYKDGDESYMVLRSTTPVSIDATAFDGVEAMNLYVPAALVSDYQAMNLNSNITVAAIEDNPIQCA